MLINVSLHHHESRSTWASNALRLKRLPPQPTCPPLLTVIKHMAEVGTAARAQHLNTGPAGGGQVGNELCKPIVKPRWHRRGPPG